MTDEQMFYTFNLSLLLDVLMPFCIWDTAGHVLMLYYDTYTFY